VGYSSQPGFREFLGRASRIRRNPLRVRKWFVLVPFMALAVALLAATAGARTTASTTSLVFGTASDPVVLDGPLVSDGESLRPIDQIFEGLVSLKPGSTRLTPSLATL